MRASSVAVVVSIEPLSAPNGSGVRLSSLAGNAPLGPSSADGNSSEELMLIGFAGENASKNLFMASDNEQQEK